MLVVLLVLYVSPIYKSDSTELLTEYEILRINGTTLGVTMYLGKYGDPKGIGTGERLGAGGSFRTVRRGAYGRPFEKITILFFAHLSLFRRATIVDPGPKRSNHAGGFSHALMRNYRCRDYREGRARLLFCGRAR